MFLFARDNGGFWCQPITRNASVQHSFIILIALMMEAAPTFETSVDNQLRTRQYITEDSELHTHPY
jgi:hypothetical protein